MSGLQLITLSGTSRRQAPVERRGAKNLRCHPPTVPSPAIIHCARRTRLRWGKDTSVLGVRLVAFLDVLGQRERFKALHLPTTPDDNAEPEVLLGKQRALCWTLRNTFGTQFTAFEAGLTNLKKHTNKTVRPKFIGFSDSPFRHVGSNTY